MRSSTRRVTRWAGWARRLGAFSLMLLIVSGVAHRHQLVETRPFLLVLALATALALLALVAAAFAFVRLWKDGDAVGRDSLAGALLAALAMSPAGWAVAGSLLHPMLNDVSTDLADPPMFGTAAGGADSHPPGSISREQARLQVDAYPAITGHRYDLPFDEAVTAVVDAIAASGWAARPARSIDGATTVEASAHTLVFGFAVEVVIRVVDEGGTVYVDMRSAGGCCRRDFGDNAARILGFYERLDAIAAKRAREVPAGT